MLKSFSERMYYTYNWCNQSIYFYQSSIFSFPFHYYLQRNRKDGYLDVWKIGNNQYQLPPSWFLVVDSNWFCLNDHSYKEFFSGDSVNCSSRKDQLTFVTVDCQDGGGFFSTRVCLCYALWAKRFQFMTSLNLIFFCLKIKFLGLAALSQEF